MALSKKQGIALGVIAAALVAVVGVGVTVGLNRPVDAVAAPEPSASATNTPAEWVHTDAVPDAVAALKASGFTPIEPGKLTVAVGAFVPPLSYVPEGETLPSGTEPNIGSLIAEGLGLEYNPVVVAWADWPLGIQSGKYDLITANVTVTEERKELYDFASYRQDLLGFAVRADSSIAKIETADDISGLKIVVGSGTNQEKVLLNWNEELAAAGKAPPTCSTTTTTPQRPSPCSRAASTRRSGRTRPPRGRRATPVRRGSSAWFRAGTRCRPTSPRVPKRATASSSPCRSC